MAVGAGSASSSKRIDFYPIDNPLAVFNESARQKTPCTPTIENRCTYWEVIKKPQVRTTEAAGSLYQVIIPNG
jgi:hypothetical protein